jgi:hypothetical protein
MIAFLILSQNILRSEEKINSEALLSNNRFRFEKEREGK